MFYTYILKNPIKDNQPFYVGKGKDRRAYRHFQSIEWKESSTNPHKTRILCQIKKAGLEPSIDIIPARTEEEAFEKEIELINLYKREIDGGILTNICFGGEGNSSGHVPVKQYTIFGDYIQTFASILEASESLGKRNGSSAIISACKQDGRSRAPYGYVWCYADETPNWDYVFNKIKPVFQWNSKGECVGKFKNMSSMHVETSYDVSTIKSFINRAISDQKIYSYPYNYQWSHTPIYPDVILAKRTRWDLL